MKVEYSVYASEEILPQVMRLIDRDLSEPYSIFTYRYFLHNWPQLCLLAKVEGKLIGAIVCRKEQVKNRSRGYIAMLAVDEAYRNKGIGSQLAKKAIETMQKDQCDEVVLETEISNKGALRLYSNLGFAKDKRLTKYYLNGGDAFRLKLWFT